MKVFLGILLIVGIGFLLQVINYYLHPNRRPSVRKAQKNGTNPAE